MANPDRGEARIVVDGKTYTLHAGTNALRALEAQFSTSSRMMTTLQIVTLADNGSMTHYVGVVWAMLRKHHADLTMEQVGDLIDAAGGPANLETIFTSLLASLVGDPIDLKRLGIDTARPTPRQARKTRRRRPDGTGADLSPRPAGSA